jgi:hypothetical protein
MLNEITKPTPIQQKYIDWYENEKKNGLREVRFSPGDCSQATVDSFIEENFRIDEAIKSGRYQSFPSEL